MNNMRNTTNNPRQIAKGPRIGSKLRLVTLAEQVSILLLTLLWFLPVEKIHGEWYTMLGEAKLDAKLGDPDAGVLMATVWFCVILCVGPIIWTLLKKKWAALVGVIHSALAALLCIFIRSSIVDNGNEMSFWFKLMPWMAVIVLVLAVARFVLTRNKKAAAVRQ